MTEGATQALAEPGSPMLTPAGEIRRRESQIVLSDRGERYRRAWIPPRAERVLVLVHGYGEHGGRYDEMAMHFAARGFAVHAFDQAGHGRTRGPRGHVDRFDRLPEEVARFVEIVGQDHADLPITLVGHSMGGLVVAAAATEHPLSVDRIVLSGALLQLGADGRPGRRQRLSLFVARLLSALAPRLGFSAGLDANGLSRDPEVVRRYRTDPYVQDRMSARFAAGLNQVIGRIMAGAGRAERPMLLLHGGQDEMAPPAGSQRFHAGLSAAIAAESALRIYPELRHEIFNEPERYEVWDDILSWLDEGRLPSDV